MWRLIGIQDTSGLRIWTTKTYRKYEADSFLVGVLGSLWPTVPPRSPEFTAVVFCDKACIQAELQKVSGGIKVFAVFLHTHLAGRRIRVRHYRGDNELEDPIVVGK